MKYTVMGFGVGITVVLLSYALSMSCSQYIGSNPPKSFYCNLVESNPIVSYYPFPKILTRWAAPLIISTLVGFAIGIYKKRG